MTRRVNGKEGAICCVQRLRLQYNWNILLLIGTSKSERYWVVQPATETLKRYLNFSQTFDSNADCVLFQGDCRELLETIPEKTVKLVITSPPYNIGKPYEKSLDLETYVRQQREIITACADKLTDDGSICWQVGNYVDSGSIIPLDILLYRIFTSLNLKLRNRIVWHFEHGLHASKRFSGRYEVILWFTKSDNYTFNLDAVRVPQKYPQKKHFKGPSKGEFSSNPLGKNPSDLWIFPNVKSNHVEKSIHPCQFPVELVERLVLALTDENDWVLDPFMGVGTSAIAALMHSRRVLGAEVISKYFEVSIDRLEKAARGELRVRHLEREVYDPNAPGKNVPPKKVNLGGVNIQQELFSNKKQ
jgi:adenine-specific DNA-methyltransferase